ncbi:MAG TPA: alpha/beta fold hydrolase [Chthoniobacterales bacterium]|nr:alpha/beta fold hydrolase [Chthoniobacterales bacterium]
MRGRRLAVVLVAFYFAVILFGGLPDQLILFPSTAPIDAGGATRRTIAFDNGEVEIWTAQSQAARKSERADVYVLRFYGNADRAERWVAAEAEMWNERAVEIWGMNYPGFGGSTGPARLSRIGPAAMAAFDELQQQAKGRPVVIFGASIGTTAALHVAAHRSVAGLILQNPPPLRQMILRQFGWWNLWLLAGPIASQIPHELDSVANAKASRAPAIFLLAEKDEVIAPRYHRLVVDAYAGEKRVITLRGAGHNTAIEGAALADLHNALDWLLPRRHGSAATTSDRPNRQ